MSEKKPNEEQIKRAKKWLVAVLTENPGLRYGSGNDDIFTGGRKSMFLVGDVSKANLQTDIDFGSIKLKELKEIIASHTDIKNESDSSIVIFGKDINTASIFFRNNGVENKTININGSSAIVIDLAQEGLVDNKLKNIFNTYVKPERKHNNSKVFIDPDGNCYDKESAKEEVAERFQAVVNYAEKHGIGERELGAILSRRLPKGKGFDRGE